MTVQISHLKTKFSHLKGVFLKKVNTFSCISSQHKCLVTLGSSTDTNVSRNRSKIKNMYGENLDIFELHFLGNSIC